MPKLGHRTLALAALLLLLFSTTAQVPASAEVRRFEITSALDPELVGEVLRVVETAADEGITLLMVTHEMTFARKVVDRVVFMHAGLIHEMGPPATLFGDPQTAELKQFFVGVALSGCRVNT